MYKTADDLAKHIICETQEVNTFGKQINGKQKKSILSHFTPCQVTKAGPIKVVAALIKANPIQIETKQANLIKTKINFKADDEPPKAIIAHSLESN